MPQQPVPLALAFGELALDLIGKIILVIERDHWNRVIAISKSVYCEIVHPCLVRGSADVFRGMEVLVIL